MELSDILKGRQEVLNAVLNDKIAPHPNQGRVVRQIFKDLLLQVIGIVNDKPSSATAKVGDPGNDAR